MTIDPNATYIAKAMNAVEYVFGSPVKGQIALDRECRTLKDVAMISLMPSGIHPILRGMPSIEVFELKSLTIFRV